MVYFQYINKLMRIYIPEIHSVLPSIGSKDGFELGTGETRAEVKEALCRDIDMLLDVFYSALSTSPNTVPGKSAIIQGAKRDINSGYSGEHWHRVMALDAVSIEMTRDTKTRTCPVDPSGNPMRIIEEQLYCSREDADTHREASAGLVRITSAIGEIATRGAEFLHAEVRLFCNTLGEEELVTHINTTGGVTVKRNKQEISIVSEPTRRKLVESAKLFALALDEMRKPE